MGCLAVGCGLWVMGCGLLVYLWDKLMVGFAFQPTTHLTLRLYTHDVIYEEVK